MSKKMMRFLLRSHILLSMKWGIYLLKGGNLVLLVLTVLACCAPYEAVQSTLIIPILGLTYPAFILTHAVFVILWVLMRSQWCILSILAIVIGQVCNPQVLNLAFANDPTVPETISIANLNAQFLIDINENELGSKAIKDMLDVDILCLQECNEDTKYDIREHMSFPYGLDDDITTVSMLSKYPILSYGQVGDATNPVNVIWWANVLIDSDTIRVYSSHLESNRISGEIPLHVVIVEEDEINLGAYFGILKHYSKFAKYRIRQAQEIKVHIANCPYPVIVCGDMNDSPMSRMYKILSSEMQDTWFAGGFGFRTTFDTWVPGMRIDHIFASEDWNIAHYKVKSVSFSDHHIVRTVLKLK